MSRPDRITPHASAWCTAWLLGLAVVIASMAVAFQGCSPIERAYVAADRETYEAVAPEFAAYVASDTTLSSRAKERRVRTLTSWDARITQAEGGSVAEVTSE